MTSIDFQALPLADLADDGGKTLLGRLLVTDQPAQAVTQAVAAGFAVMPAGGLTSAIGSYDYATDKAAGFAGVIAIRPKGAVAAITAAPGTRLEDLATNQVLIDPHNGLVSAGAGLTFTQVAAALAEQVGPTARVLVDLTSIGSAFVGGVVATGAMGPLRTRPSASLHALALADGHGVRIVSGDAILSVEGMQGWTGMVTAATFRYFLLPASEFGLVLPVQGSDIDTVGGLLAYLEPWTRVDLPVGGTALSQADTVLNGIELVSRDSLESFVEHAPEPARTKAQGLLQSCEYAGSDWLACITGWSDQSVDDVLFSLLDPVTETIGGVSIEFGVGFSSGQEMETFRAIREGAPDMARTKARNTPPGRLKPWTTSTDINIKAPADAGTIADLMACYGDYRITLKALMRDLKGSGVDGELSAYGHLSPHGIDPHHRFTLFADLGKEDQLAWARGLVSDAKKTLIRDLMETAKRGGAIITGGEKGVPSLVEIARAAGGDEALPDNLRAMMDRARNALKSAHPAFSFRAPPELVL